ncbi:hypothetical protein H257_00577 [Aphanomyces astaci]|uniref:Uncharacterized protein n=2 Tax=Aphanomyces astaci TaxID=112090 RepID=W4HCA5_APHAT|nr:hypothetical protein H257_00577 [Aphanomyces astaci]ETV89221.1 hypothetical protein H257_00577 [Aphanomyces astaci]|eukprot:XP_009821621.1 hypothetical protein H257_00577 [Aphanomyces astaci]
MVKHSHLLKLFCVSFLLVSGVAAQDDGTPAPTTTRGRTTRAPITFSPITISPITISPITVEPTTVEPTTVEPTTSRATTLKPTTAFPTTTPVKTTVEPTTLTAPTTPTVTETTEAPVATTVSLETTLAPLKTTTAAPTTTRRPTTTKPVTTQAALIEVTVAPTTTLRPTTSAPVDDDSSSLGVYIGLGVGGAVLLAGIVFLLLKLKQPRDDDDDDYDEVQTYKITAPSYTKAAPPVAVLNAYSPPVKAPQVVTQQYNPYSNHTSNQQQRSLQPTANPVVVGSYLNTTSTHRDSEFEYEAQNSAVLPPQSAGGYDTDRESEFASQSFLNNPSGAHSVYEFKDSIDSRDSGLSEDLQPSPKRNGRARVSSVEL